MAYPGEKQADMVLAVSSKVGLRDNCPMLNVKLQVLTAGIKSKNLLMSIIREHTTEEDKKKDVFRLNENKLTTNQKKTLIRIASKSLERQIHFEEIIIAQWVLHIIPRKYGFDKTPKLNVTVCTHEFN